MATHKLNNGYSNDEPVSDIVTEGNELGSVKEELGELVDVLVVVDDCELEEVVDCDDDDVVEVELDVDIGV